MSKTEQNPQTSESQESVLETGDILMTIAARDAADLVACQQILEEGSKSFRAASRLLPSRMRPHTAGVYAFCRIADDLIDDGDDPDAALVELTYRLDRIYAGRPFDHPVDRVFTRAVEEHGIPKTAMTAMLEGFAWDRDNRRYKTIDELLDYCARVASTVGVMMTALMGRREPHVIARASDLGLAMQLTNIARDVGEDASRGRLYLPTDWLEEKGLDPDEFLAHPEPGPEIFELTKRLLSVADEFYALADLGIPMLPRDARVGIRAARLIYADIGREIEKAGFDSVSQRAFTSKWRKLRLVLDATDAWFWRQRDVHMPAHASTQFLVDAMAPAVDQVAA